MAETNDIYEAKLDDVKNSLQECQQEKGLKSCFECPSLFECTLRTQYVRAVYESMSKGEVGGFDF